MRYTTIEETPRNRPIGVTIIALLLGIQAVLGISIGVVTMIGGLGSTLSFLGIIATVLGLIELFFAWGLWTLQLLCQCDQTMPSPVSKKAHTARKGSHSPAHIALGSNAAP